MDTSHVYVRALALACFYSHISTRSFRRALTASLDNCAEIKSAPSVALLNLAKFGGRCRKAMLGVWMPPLSQPTQSWALPCLAFSVLAVLLVLVVSRFLAPLFCTEDRKTRSAHCVQHTRTRTHARTHAVIHTKKKKKKKKREKKRTKQQPQQSRKNNKTLTPIKTWHQTTKAGNKQKQRLMLLNCSFVDWKTVLPPKIGHVSYGHITEIDKNNTITQPLLPPLKPPLKNVIEIKTKQSTSLPSSRKKKEKKKKKKKKNLNE